MSPTPAELTALKVADAAAMSPASAYGLPSVIVFALGSAGLLIDPETAAELAEYRRQLPLLLAERHTTNEALSQASEQVADMVQQLASASASMDVATKAIQADGKRIAELEARDAAVLAVMDRVKHMTCAEGTPGTSAWGLFVDLTTARGLLRPPEHNQWAADDEAPAPAVTS